MKNIFLDNDIVIEKTTMEKVYWMLYPTILTLAVFVSLSYWVLVHDPSKSTTEYILL